MGKGTGLTLVGGGSCFLYSDNKRDKRRSNLPDAWRRGSAHPSEANVWPTARMGHLPLCESALECHGAGSIVIGEDL